MKSVTAREFNRDVSAAKRAALTEPLVITDRGTPAFVLVSIDEYRTLRGMTAGGSLLDRLSMEEDIDFEPVRIHGLARRAEF